MASKQTRRSFSIRGEIYQGLRTWAEDNDRSMSGVLEEETKLFLDKVDGIEPVQTTFKNVSLCIQFPSDREYEEAYRIWYGYYAEMEAIDRSSPHYPARSSRSKAVIPTFSMEGRNMGMESLRIARYKCRSMNQSKVIEAKICASDDHDREMEPCECISCLNITKGICDGRKS